MAALMGRWIVFVAIVPLLALAIAQCTLAKHTNEGRAAFVSYVESLPTTHPEVSQADLTAMREEAAAFDQASFAMQECGAFGFTAEPTGLGEDYCWYALQPIWARWIAIGLLALSAAVGLTVAYALSAAARDPRQAYRGFVMGWTSLRIFSILHAIGQAALAVFLAVWITAVFAGFYSIRVIAIVAAVAGTALVYSLRALVRRPQHVERVHGIVLRERDAPQFFERLEQIAGQIPTTPPNNVVLGIDDNFFVTELPLIASPRIPTGDAPPDEGVRLEGRTLFVSVALMQVLTTEEADAVLAHELGHLAAGDAQHLARLSPLQRNCAAYSREISQIFVFGLDGAFEWFLDAFGRIQAERSRAAEFEADATAARCIDPQSTAVALIKITAYSSYRSDEEEKLIDAMSEHESLDIQAMVRGGFLSLLGDDEFLARIASETASHPFDTHPPLLDRLARLGTALTQPQDVDETARHPTSTHLDLIPGVSAAADELWRNYQERFANVHRERIAYKLQPESPEEIARLEQQFPRRSFATVDASIEYVVDWRGLSFDGEDFAFADVLEVFRDNRELTIAVEGRAYPRIKLATLGPNGSEFVDVLLRYWERYRCAAAEGRPS